MFLVTKAATPLPVKAKTPLPVKKESPAPSKDSKNAAKTSQAAKKPAESKREGSQEAAAPKPTKQAPKADTVASGTVASAAGAAKGWAKIEKGKLAYFYCTFSNLASATCLVKKGSETGFSALNLDRLQNRIFSGANFRQESRTGF